MSSKVKSVSKTNKNKVESVEPTVVVETTQTKKNKVSETKVELVEPVEPAVVLETEQVIKKNKFDGIDKGDKPNLETAAYNLEFNVRLFKSWLKEHYGLCREKVPNIVNAHCMLAACCQITCNMLLAGISDKSKKTKSGLVDVDYDTLYNYVLLTSCLYETYGGVLKKYDENLDYSKELCIDRKTLLAYIEKYIFHNNNTVSLNNSTLNFVMFLLVQTNIKLADTALLCSEIGKAHSISVNTILTAVKIHFKGKLLLDTLKKLDNVSMLIKSLSNREQKNNEKVDNLDNDHDVDDEHEDVIEEVEELED